VVKDVAAIVLAAGRSRRMVAFKPLLPFGDSTVTESCINNFISAGIEEIVVVIGHRGDQVRAQLEPYPVTFVVNPNPDSEMSASIALGVGRVSEEARAVLVTPVDHPAVPAKIIGLIVDEWRRTHAGLVQPEHAGRGGHPVLIDLRYRNELLHPEPGRRLRSLFDQHREEVRRLPVTSPFVARDMDTWEDYRDLHLAVFGRKPEQTAAGQSRKATNENPSGHI
jgi:molybdenum cofactor cytidylyltransferase